MTSFAFPPLAPAGPVSGWLALDFGPAALLVGVALLLIGVFLAASAERRRSSTPPPPRSRAAVQLRRLGRSFGRRAERRRYVAPASHARLA